jgi:hypothetical protein
MSADGSITIGWGEGETRFRLAIGEWRELQAKTTHGPFKLFQRLNSGDWHVDDLVEVIRLGLIGGGALPSEARRLVDYYVVGRPLLESVPLAISIIGAGLIGGDQEVGKGPGPGAATDTGGSTLPQSTARVQ